MAYSPYPLNMAATTQLSTPQSEGIGVVGGCLQSPFPYNLIIIQRPACMHGVWACVQFRECVMVSNHFATSNTFKSILTYVQGFALFIAAAIFSLFWICNWLWHLFACVCVDVCLLRLFRWMFLFEQFCKTLTSWKKHCVPEWMQHYCMVQLGELCIAAVPLNNT